MKPSIDARLASVVRALTAIVAPGLRDDAGLAKEQVQLAVGQLAIIRGQLDASFAFEEQELADAKQLSLKLIALTQPAVAVTQLQQAVDSLAANGSVREQEAALKTATHEFVLACYDCGDAQIIAAMSDTVLSYGEQRSLIDRKWFAPMGFDGDIDNIPD